MGNDDERSESDTKRLSDAVLRRMLSTPPGKKKRKARKKAKRAK
jgi:hypothetical protein